jgi:DNA-binding Lrp family transcriptional regulator
MSKKARLGDYMHHKNVKNDDKKNFNKSNSNVSNSGHLQLLSSSPSSSPPPVLPARLDSTDVNIIRELINNSNARSADIAYKYKIPLSTIQRRRTRLERSSILKHRYNIDVRQFGWRTADILIGVEKGDCVQVAREILEDYKDNVISTSLRIGNPQVNVSAKVIYKSSQELFNLIQIFRAIPNVAFVEWYEEVEVVGFNYASLVNTLFPDATI